MRKREVIEPRYLNKAEADAITVRSRQQCANVRQGCAGSAGVEERGERTRYHMRT